MSQALIERVQQLEEKVHALQQLLLSHVLAFDAVDRPATDATLAIAFSQRDAALNRGRDPVAVRLAGLIEAIQKTRD